MVDQTQPTNQNLQGTSLNDTLEGGTGNDTLTAHGDGPGGVDVVSGGAGNDKLTGDYSDTLVGGAGDDTINLGYNYGGKYAQGEGHGGAGNDVLNGSNGNQALFGGDGNDTITGGNDYATADTDTLVGGAGDDSIVSGQTAAPVNEGWAKNGDLMQGGAGNDTITGGTATDTLEGGTGNDVMTGGAGTDSIVGGEGNDLAYGDNGANMLVNGSLEAGMTNAAWGVRTLDGWTSAGGSSEVWATGHNGVASSDGQNHVEIDSYADRQDFMYQEVQTAAGENYEISFQLRARPGAGVNDALEFYFNGEKIAAQVPPSTDEWTTYSFTVVGSGGMDRVEFRETMGESDALGPLLDNIVMVPASNDTIHGGAGLDTLHGQAGHDSVTGGTGNDTLTGDTGNDLLAGGGASSEWRLVDGEWIYDPNMLRSPDNPDPYFVADEADDLLIGGKGKDVLLGNAGDDTMIGGDSRDRLYGHRGEDKGYGGAGDDRIYLGAGNDYAEGNSGADTIGGDHGDDVIYGDNVAENLLSGVPKGLTTFKDFTAQSAWTDGGQDGMPGMSQEIDTDEGETYTFTFDLAANLPAGKTQGAVEVLWNGEVIDTISSASGVFESHTVTFEGDGEPGTLTIRNLPEDDAAPVDAGPAIDTSGPIASYQKTMSVGGQEMDVTAFAPGQAKLFQVISGQLKVFDPVESTYVDAGPNTGLKINAIGFNVQDDMIYGLARQDGTDINGVEVDKNDLVMIDANGAAHRIGKTTANDYVGDFDDQGNLWTFHTSLDRMTRIDVDNLDANGNPVVENFYLPKGLMKGRMYDIAYNAEEEAFYAVEPPTQNGTPGYVHKIDVSNFQPGSNPEITTIPISGTLFDGVMKEGMPKGAYGAVFLDGDGNLYAGLNNGDHDLGAEANSGAIYQIKIDEAGGHAYAEFRAKSQATGSNDGAVDPRSSDPFAEVDQTSTVQIRAPELQLIEGSDDRLMGGIGNDTIHGGGGNDEIFGGADNDVLNGDAGDDRVLGGAGDDMVSGGLGNDFLIGGAGQNTLDGGYGDDKIKGGSETDIMSGGDGADKMWSGLGDDSLSGGRGDDQLVASAGNDTLDGGAGKDHLIAGGGHDVASGGKGDDLIQGGFGHDTIDGGAGTDKIVGGAGSDVISGGGGRDHLWGGEWSADGTSDTFAYGKGGDTDTIHDFEVNHDRIDLSEYGLSFEDIQSRMVDRGWATEINLEGIDKSGAGDKLMLKNVKPEDLDDTNFIT